MAAQGCLCLHLRPCSRRRPLPWTDAASVMAADSARLRHAPWLDRAGPASAGRAARRGWPTTSRSSDWVRPTREQKSPVRLWECVCWREGGGRRLEAEAVCGLLRSARARALKEEHASACLLMCVDACLRRCDLPACAAPAARPAQLRLDPSEARQSLRPPPPSPPSSLPPGHTKLAAEVAGSCAGGVVADCSESGQTQVRTTSASRATAAREQAQRSQSVPYDTATDDDPRCHPSASSPSPYVDFYK